MALIRLFPIVVFFAILGQSEQQAIKTPSTLSNALLSLQNESTPVPTFTNSTTATSYPPSSAPTAAETESYPPSDAPTLLPSQMPSGSPTSSPSAVPSAVPTAVPSAVPTAVPSAVPSNSPSSFPSGFPTAPPSAFPSANPSGSPSEFPSTSPSAPPTMPHRGRSIGRKILKAIGWMFFIVLSGLLFAAAMSNRYRIYYILRETWYKVRQLPCTQWILSRLPFVDNDVSQDGSLNEIIFDDGAGDLTEGLLMS